MKIHSINSFHFFSHSDQKGIVIGTFITKSGQIFWSYARRLPLDAHQIVCWKFCHVLHKVLRDGHPKVIPDSYRYRQWLLELCKMWGLLKQGYGKLIHSYCSLLVNKIDFHIRVSFCFFDDNFRY